VPVWPVRCFVTPHRCYPTRELDVNSKHKHQITLQSNIYRTLQDVSELQQYTLPDSHEPEHAQKPISQKIIIITHHPNKEAIFNDGVSTVRRVPGCANKYHVRRSRLPADKQQINETAYHIFFFCRYNSYKPIKPAIYLPKCMTLNDLCARFKVIDSLNAAKMAKYSLVIM